MDRITNAATLSLKDLQLEPNPNCPNGLHGLLRIANTMFHVTAIEVTVEGDEVSLVNPEWEDEWSSILDLADGMPELVRINGADYLIGIYPFQS